jgi:nicotinamide mononucleotide transporter
MTWIEILGFVTGAVSVILAVRESAWNWLVGIANNIFFFLLFWKSKLYADALLQIIYAVISVYGWWNWVHGGTGSSKLAISKTTKRTAFLLFGITALATGIMTYLLTAFSDSKVPFWDGVTTALSLTAQFMLSRKLLENWWVWMTADIIYILLYCYKALYLTGFLYAIFFALCIAGYRGWLKAFKSISQQIEAMR